MSGRARLVVILTVVASLVALLRVPVELNAQWAPDAGAADIFLHDRWIELDGYRVDLDNPPGHLWVWRLGMQSPPITMPYADYTDIPIDDLRPLWRLRWGRLLLTLALIACAGGGLLTLVLRSDRRRRYMLGGELHEARTALARALRRRINDRAG